MIEAGVKKGPDRLYGVGSIFFSSVRRSRSVKAIRVPAIQYKFEANICNVSIDEYHSPFPCSSHLSLQLAWTEIPLFIKPFAMCYNCEEFSCIHGFLHRRTVGGCSLPDLMFHTSTRSATV